MEEKYSFTSYLCLGDHRDLVTCNLVSKGFIHSIWKLPRLSCNLLSIFHSWVYKPAFLPCIIVLIWLHWKTAAVIVCSKLLNHQLIGYLIDDNLISFLQWTLWYFKFHDSLFIHKMQILLLHCMSTDERPSLNGLISHSWNGLKVFISCSLKQL